MYTIIFNIIGNKIMKQMTPLETHKDPCRSIFQFCSLIFDSFLNAKMFNGTFL